MWRDSSSSQMGEVLLLEGVGRMHERWSQCPFSRAEGTPKDSETRQKNPTPCIRGGDSRFLGEASSRPAWRPCCLPAGCTARPHSWLHSPVAGTEPSADSHAASHGAQDRAQSGDVRKAPPKHLLTSGLPCTSLCCSLNLSWRWASCLTAGWRTTADVQSSLLPASGTGWAWRGRAKSPWPLRSGKSAWGSSTPQSTARGSTALLSHPRGTYPRKCNALGTDTRQNNKCQRLCFYTPGQKRLFMKGSSYWA